jgi:hypothetical protein
MLPFNISGVVLRESGGPSTPRLLDSIAVVSGILDPPLSRGMTSENVASEPELSPIRPF